MLEGIIWKRLLIRTITMAAAVFIAESVPTFGYILDLLGATTISALTFIFPGWFYIALNRKLLHREAQKYSFFYFFTFVF